MLLPLFTFAILALAENQLLIWQRCGTVGNFSGVYTEYRCFPGQACAPDPRSAMPAPDADCTPGALNCTCDHDTYGMRGCGQSVTEPGLSLQCFYGLCVEQSFVGNFRSYCQNVTVETCLRMDSALAPPPPDVNETTGPCAATSADDLIALNDTTGAPTESFGCADGVGSDRSADAGCTSPTLPAPRESFPRAPATERCASCGFVNCQLIFHLTRLLRLSIQEVQELEFDCDGICKEVVNALLFGGKKKKIESALQEGCSIITEAADSYAVVGDIVSFVVDTSCDIVDAVLDGPATAVCWPSCLALRSIPGFEELERTLNQTVSAAVDGGLDTLSGQVADLMGKLFGDTCSTFATVLLADEGRVVPASCSLGDMCRANAAERDLAGLGEDDEGNPETLPPAFVEDDDGNIDNTLASSSSAIALSAVVNLMYGLSLL